MKDGQQIRFKSTSREGSWNRGDTGTIEKVLVERPQATSDIFLIRLAEDRIVWATHEDIEISYGDQLTLF